MLAVAECWGFPKLREVCGGGSVGAEEEEEDGEEEECGGSGVRWHCGSDGGGGKRRYWRSLAVLGEWSWEIRD